MRRASRLPRSLIRKSPPRFWDIRFRLDTVRSCARFAMSSSPRRIATPIGPSGRSRTARSSMRSMTSCTFRASTNACATSLSGKDASPGASVTSARLPIPRATMSIHARPGAASSAFPRFRAGSSRSRAKSPHGASSRRNAATFRASGCLPTRRSSKSRARRPSHVRRSSRCVGSPTSSTDVTSTRSSMR